MKSRLVRVFISSTFRDFIQERDELVKKVFPELRQKCKERFVELLEVDLRWGITEEQAKGGETLRICLEEIDRCRPSAPVFFVGLLGERYGWIPPKEFFTKEVLEDPNLGWVKEHIDGKSVTELEIFHGVLRSEKMRDRAFFYFRNDGYQGRHWQEIQSHHQKISPPVSKEDFTNAKSERGQASDDQKQSELKRAIRDASLAWDPRNYETPEEMGRMVLEDLWAAIDRVFPAGEVPDENERHRLEHDAFGQSRTKGYVNRAGLFEKLDVVPSCEEPPVVAVTGESGGGKSALLAAWLEQLDRSAPSRRFVHYIGGTPESSSAKSIVLRLMNQIRTWGAVSEPVPDDFGQAVDALPEWLARGAAGQDGGFLIVLDALNQLESSRDRSLWWLPKQMPPGVRLVVSTLPGESEEELRARSWLENELRVPPLKDQERKQIITGYLGRFTKQLESGFVDRLARAPQAANPLFLRVVLDELRIRARHEELGPMLEKMLKAKDPAELFVQVLKNLEEFDKERKNLVREAMGYLAVARRGLSEGELLQLLSEDPQPSSNPLPRHYWSPLYLALEDSLVSRNGQLSFFHDFLKEAVMREYLDEEWERSKVHTRFTYLAGRLLTGNSAGATLDHYLARYSSFHAGALGDMQDLARLAVAFSSSQFEMLSHSESILLIADACTALGDGHLFHNDRQFLENVAALLEMVRSPDSARPLCRKLLNSGVDWRQAFHSPGLDGRGATYIFAGEWAKWILELDQEQANREIEFLIDRMKDVEDALCQAAVYAFKYVILGDPNRFTTNLLGRVLSGWQENRLMLTNLIMQLAIDGLHLEVIDSYEPFWKVTWEYNKVELGLLKGALAFRNLPSPHADQGEAVFFQRLESRRSGMDISSHCFASKRVLDRFWSLGQSGNSLKDDLWACLREQNGLNVLELLLESPFWEVGENAAEVLSEKMEFCESTRCRIRELAHDVDGDKAFSAFGAYSRWALRNGEVEEYLNLVYKCAFSTNCQIRGLAAESLMSFLRDFGGRSLKDLFEKVLPALKRFLHDTDIWPVQETLHNLQLLDDGLAAVGVDWRVLLDLDQAPILSMVGNWEKIGPEWEEFEKIAREQATLRRESI